MALIKLTAARKNAESPNLPKFIFIESTRFKFQPVGSVVKVSPLMSSQEGGNDGQSYEVVESMQAILTLVNGTGIFASDLNSGLTAFAGGGQGSAVALTKTINNLSVVATAADSVKLPAVAAGLVRHVINNGAAAASVFPQTGGIIDSLAVNTAASVAPGAYTIFYSDGVQWYTVLAY